MREYPILHLETNESKETACSKKRYKLYLCLNVILDTLSCSFTFVSKCNIGYSLMFIYISV
jgi:hypothetical protein